MQSKISHLDINVSNYREAIIFYDLVLTPIGFKRINCTKEWTSYSDGVAKLIICETEELFKSYGYHRKRIGLNHIAFYADSKKDVDQFTKDVLVKNNIKTLYTDGASGDEDYYAVFFEGPDRLKLEYVYAPSYCDINQWPSNIEDDFNPYIEEDISEIQYTSMVGIHNKGILEIADSLVEYFTKSGKEQLSLDLKTQKGLVAIKNGQLLGFITYFSQQANVEIGWMGICKNYQNKGIGKRLLSELVNELMKLGFKKVQVKTLDESVEYEPYEKTRKFYFSQGFKKISVNYYEDNLECEAEAVLELSF